MKQLTDEEVLAMPARMLSKSERARRRRVRRRIAENKRREAAARKISGQGKKTRMETCKGANKRGSACASKVYKNTKHCRWHLTDEEREELGLEPLKEVINRKRSETMRLKRRKESAVTLMASVTETAAEKILARYFSALGLELQGFDDEGNPIIFDHGAEAGIRVYGESREGDINLSDIPNLAAQVQIAEKLMDRIHGKPKQTSVLEGNPNKPIAVQPVRSVDRAQEIARLLGKVGVINSEVLSAAPEKPVIDSQETNVVPLKPKDERH